MNTNWRDRATCRDEDAELWFPVGNDADISAPVRICEGCPVRRECGEDALTAGENEGIRAGFWLRRRDEREALARALPHVTPARKANEHACITCGGPLQGIEKTKCLPCRRDLVLAAPAHERMRLLKQHRTYKQIAAESGLPLSSVLSLRPKQGVMYTARTTYEAIMSVPLPVGVA